MLSGPRNVRDDGTDMGDEDELSAVRRRLPVGSRVRGRVSGWPAAVGQAGVSVDVGDPVRGWVDVLWLPEEPERWPAVGQTGYFQVLQHRGHEIRLLPLDAGLRGRRCKQLPWSGPEWVAVTERHPVGSTVEATVDYVFTGNREYTVRFGECWGVVEYDGTPPPVGDVVTLVVVELLEWTRDFVLREAAHEDHAAGTG
jgi:hypothetical protein